jgi:C-terminal processing protease CtpA/Prc
VNIELAGVSTAQREANRAKNPLNAEMLMQSAKLDGSKENITYRFINDTVATLRVRNFVDEGFTSSVDDAMSELTKAKAIILDLRGNGGGADMWGAWLVSKFTPKPFRYFDRIHLPTINPSFTNWKQETKEDMKNYTVVDPRGGFLATSKLHPGVGQQTPADKPFTGKLIVLANGLTFSTAADVCAQLRNLANTIFVGEETGGGYAGNTSGSNARFNFPHSGFRLNIHVYDYWNAVPAREKGRGIIPDYTIENKVKELEKGVDAQWEQAWKLAR